jgi:delta 1-pyrroline-5-carboxylate dehydrogenase
MSDTKQLSHYIDGQWVSGTSASESLNPSNTSDIVAKVPGGDKKIVDSAVAAAKAAFPAWANASPEVRSDLLDKVGAMIMARADELGRLLSREEGKTLPEGKGEVMRAARIFKFFAGEALRRHGVTVDSTRPGVAVETYREPLGVFAMITPWNFPIAIPAWKSAPALAFGNTVVIKPASLTPATAHAMTEIIHEAGFRRASSISSLAAAPWVALWSSIPTWPACLSPVARARAPASRRPRCRTTRACSSKWAARIRSWCSMTAISTARCNARSTAASLRPGSAARPPAASS